MPLQQLFGGAIQAEYPSNLTDASDLRQVPDTQEVFMSNNSDLSLILEVLELVQDEGAANDLEVAVKYHFESLAHDNSAFSSTVSSVVLPTSANGASAIGSNQGSTSPVLGPSTITGLQRIAKFNKPESEADNVLVQLALWRIPSKNVDLVLTVNYPLQASADQPVALSNGAVANGSSTLGADITGQKLATGAFEQAVRTLEIRDFGLFAG